MQYEPISEDKVDEAKNVLYTHDPSFMEFVQQVEGSVEHSFAEKMDMRQYMSAVLQHKERIDELVDVQEFMEQRKKARAEAAEAMGMNSPWL